MVHNYNENKKNIGKNSWNFKGKTQSLKTSVTAMNVH